MDQKPSRLVSIGPLPERLLFSVHKTSSQKTFALCPEAPFPKDSRLVSIGSFPFWSSVSDFQLGENLQEIDSRKDIYKFFYKKPIYKKPSTIHPKN